MTHMQKESTTEQHKVYLGLGSNLGNRKAIMREAIEKINEKVGAVVRQSSFYETAPWGYESPNKFINACIRIDSPLAPHDLLETTQKIEHELGRVHKTSLNRYEDRIIDIDILLYDNLEISEPDLQIPHPLMYKRDFVMRPLKEIL